MRCPACQHENPAGQKFCGDCGARLASLCPSCNAPNPPGQKFCGECGGALGQAAQVRGRFAAPESYTLKHLAEKILTSKAALWSCPAFVDTYPLRRKEVHDAQDTATVSP
jgi:hypothetical protein